MTLFLPFIDPWTLPFEQTANFFICTSIHDGDHEYGDDNLMRLPAGSTIEDAETKAKEELFVYWGEGKETVEEDGDFYDS